MLMHGMGVGGCRCVINALSDWSRCLIHAPRHASLGVVMHTNRVSFSRCVYACYEARRINGCLYDRLV